MSNTVYAAVHIEKRIEVDNFENGCDPDTSYCTMCEKCDIVSDSLSGLIDKAGKHFGLAMDDVFLNDDENGVVNVIGFNRMENAHGDTPSDSELVLWKEGRCRLWLADYTFAIEKRTVSYLTRGDFESAGIKFHS